MSIDLNTSSGTPHFAPLSHGEIISALEQKVAQTLSHAESFIGQKLPQPKFDISLRGKTAGQMCAQTRFGRTQYKIRLNLALAKLHLPVFVNEIIPHEISHLVIMHCYGIKKSNKIRPHGPEWKQIMLQCFQLEPKIYHDLALPASANTSKKKLQTFTYQCQCQDHTLTQIRHKRMLSGTHYHCIQCKQKLRPKNTFEIQTPTNQIG